jgi:hypothetical protein
MECMTIDFTTIGELSSMELARSVTVICAGMATDLVGWQQENGYYEIFPLLPRHPSDGDMMLAFCGVVGSWPLIDGLPPPWNIILQWTEVGLVAWGYPYDAVHGCLHFRQPFRLKFIIWRG